ncbi:hypothetical protein JCM10213v2_000044 [Rhodosporidiobolus nylandii]
MPSFPVARHSSCPSFVPYHKHSSGHKRSSAISLTRASPPAPVPEPATAVALHPMAVSGGEEWWNALSTRVGKWRVEVVSPSERRVARAWEDGLSFSSSSAPSSYSSSSDAGDTHDPIPHTVTLRRPRSQTAKRAARTSWPIPVEKVERSRVAEVGEWGEPEGTGADELMVDEQSSSSNDSPHTQDERHFFPNPRARRSGFELNRNDYASDSRTVSSVSPFDSVSLRGGRASAPAADRPTLELFTTLPPNPRLAPPLFRVPLGPGRSDEARDAVRKGRETEDPYKAFFEAWAEGQSKKAQLGVDAGKAAADKDEEMRVGPLLPPGPCSSSPLHLLTRTAFAALHRRRRKPALRLSLAADGPLQTRFLAKLAAADEPGAGRPIRRVSASRLTQAGKGKGKGVKQERKTNWRTVVMRKVEGWEKKAMGAW